VTLGAICAFGCPLPSINLENPHSFQQSVPITICHQDFQILKPLGHGQEHATTLFVRVSHRCRYIDGIFVQWNLEATSAMIAPIQITLATSHVYQTQMGYNQEADDAECTAHYRGRRNPHPDDRLQRSRS